MFPAWIWGVAGFSAFVMQEICKPRLPVYSMRMLPSFPRLKWGGEGISEGIKTSLSAEITFHNDNYIDIHVHALSFDVFYMNWDGDLEHVGHIQDRVQVENNTNSRQQEARHDKEDSSSSEATAAHSKQQKQERKRWRKYPLWQIGKRSDFSIVDDLYMFLDKTWKMITNSRFWSSLWHGSGVLLVPTTGVAMIKAHPGGTPLTLQLVCDNVLDTWTFYITGVECTLQNLQPGWSNMSDTVLSLRQYAVSHLRANTTGGVLQHPHTLPSKKDIMYTVAWEEALKLV